jgi:hypothetical protein
MKAHRLLASAVCCLIPAFGHHNIATEFDVSKTVRISGTISKVDFLNPHVTISLDVKNADGTMTQWRVDTGAPNVLIRNGITKAQLGQGTTIVIEGYPAKDGAPRADGRTLILAGGIPAGGLEFRAGPWEHDPWNPLRDPNWNWCEANPRPESCLQVKTPVK